MNEAVAQRFRKRLMRRCTKAERVMKNMLKSLGVRYKFQYVLLMGESFIILDFYLKDLNTAIEVDGWQHLVNPIQITRDNERSKYLSSLGINEIRISNDRVLTRSQYDKTERWLKRTLERIRYNRSRL